MDPSTDNDPFNHPDAGFNALPEWTWVGCYGGYYLQADLLAAFEHGFFTRLWNGRSPDVLAGYLSAGVTVHRPKQVHGANVLAASQAAAEPWPEADGLHSDSGGQSLWVCGADCTPVLLADPVRGVVAACHAGWRGVAAGLLAQTVGRLQTEGSHPGDLLAALGPAISGTCYQVERQVSEAVAQRTTGGLMALRAAGAVSEDSQPGRDRLDIRAAARLQLEQLGLAREQIAVCPLCTMSDAALFHSWRRDGVRAVQWSGIVSQA